MRFLKYFIYSLLLFTWKKKAAVYWEKHALWVDFKTEVKAEVVGYALIYTLSIVFICLGMLIFLKDDLLLLITISIGIITAFIVTSFVTALWFCIAKNKKGTGN